MDRERKEIRQALVRAAEQIERNPKSHNFSFGIVRNYPGYGPCGCALAWTGKFLGNPQHFDEVAYRLFQCRQRRMEDSFNEWAKGKHYLHAVEDYFHVLFYGDRFELRNEPEKVAENMRKVAESFYND